jgi:hypothetical protein
MHYLGVFARSCQTRLRVHAAEPGAKLVCGRSGDQSIACRAQLDIPAAVLLPQNLIRIRNIMEPPDGLRFHSCCVSQPSSVWRRGRIRTHSQSLRLRRPVDMRPPKRNIGGGRRAATPGPMTRSGKRLIHRRSSLQGASNSCRNRRIGAWLGPIPIFPALAPTPIGADPANNKAR